MQFIIIIYGVNELLSINCWFSFYLFAGSNVWLRKLKRRVSDKYRSIYKEISVGIFHYLTTNSTVIYIVVRYWLLLIKQFSMETEMTVGECLPIIVFFYSKAFNCSYFFLLVLYWCLQRLWFSQRRSITVKPPGTLFALQPIRGNQNRFFKWSVTVWEKCLSLKGP